MTTACVRGLRSLFDMCEVNELVRLGTSDKIETYRINEFELLLIDR